MKPISESSPPRFLFIRQLTKDLETLTFEVFEAELQREPMIKLKVDMASRIVKQRDGSRVSQEVARGYRDGFAKLLLLTLG